MRQYIQKNEQVKKAEKIFCNRCGKELPMDHGMVKAGVFSMDFEWGYFSEKDGQKHSFDLCEACYDEMTGQFQIPVTVVEK
ncbi:MAG: hypothetical protein PHN80_03185 [Hespellia sp.]|nr:hypothetical protein [Hespellia sp.]